MIINDGHANIDNNAEFYSQSRISSMISLRMELNLPFIYLELEPYRINRSEIFKNLLLVDHCQLIIILLAIIIYPKILKALNSQELFFTTKAWAWNMATLAIGGVLGFIHQYLFLQTLRVKKFFCRNLSRN